VINIRTEFSCGLTEKNKQANHIVEKSNIQWVREGRTKELNLQHKDITIQNRKNNETVNTIGGLKPLQNFKCIFAFLYIMKTQLGSCINYRRDADAGLQAGTSVGPSTRSGCKATLPCHGSGIREVGVFQLAACEGRQLR
jgi:hypothetical protein